MPKIQGGRYISQSGFDHMANRTMASNSPLSNMDKSRNPKLSTEKNFQANVDSLNKTFHLYNTQINNSNAGQKFKRSPRVGAGSLGPNFKQKVD